MSSRVVDLEPVAKTSSEIEKPHASTALTTTPPSKPEPPASAEVLENDIEKIRENLGDLISELDHRRHRLNPMYIIRHNQWPIAVGGFVLLGICLGGAAWHIERERSRRTLLARANRLRHVLGGALGGGHETVVEVHPNIAMKILTAAGTAAAAVATRKMVEGMFARARAKTAEANSSS